jgi:class 3 adenylate cyclase/tetratricopeptide (TPR) repeat protein/ribosomal protein L40E
VNCLHCQAQNPGDALFCESCGFRLELACSNCGAANRFGATFCKKCGQRLIEAGQASLVIEGKFGSVETYTPKHLAKKILNSKSSLEGERKQVTVLFADIKGSTKLLERLDPEEAQKIIDPVLHIMMDAVHRYEGTVNQILGDGIMALFGAPLAHEDHALRACYAALAMQHEMRRYRQKLGQSEETGLQIGVGMNSGEVVVRSIDTDLNIDYSALGHTTHLAARMQELSGPGVALISSSTLRQVEGFIQVRALGAVQAKGISQLVEAYEITVATTARTRVQAGAARGLTPLVGRSTEIDVFKKLVEQVTAGRGQILAMIGEAGVGKSRLVHEFGRHRLPPGWIVLEGTSVSYGKATPYFPLVEMLRRYLGIGPGEGTEEIQSRVGTHLLEVDSALKDTIPPVLSLLGALPEEKTHSGQDGKQQTPPPDIGEVISRFHSMDPQQRRRYTLDAVNRVLIRESQRQPLLVVFEDLHWIDNETQGFLDSLMNSVPMARILVLVNYRPEYTHGWAEKSYYTQLRVDPLQPTSAEQLLQYLLGRNKDLAPLKALLVHRTEGNPFFAEESVRSLVETGVLVGEKGAYRPALKINEIHIPSTVQNVVADRIDRLPIDEKHLLQTAAVIGVKVPFGLLRVVSQLPDDQLYQCLAHLRSAEFLFETSLFPESEYTFKHALTTEVAYGALLHERRTFLHAKIVSALEQIQTNNLQDYVETLAHHALHGELWDKAVPYLSQSGAKALACSAFTEAVCFLEQGVEALGHASDSQAKLEWAIDLRLQLRNALFLLGDSRKLYHYLKEAESLAQKLGDEPRIGRVLNFLCSYAGLAGDPDGAVSYGRRALALPIVNIDPSIGAVTHYYLGAAYNKMGSYREAIDVLSQGLQGIRSDLLHERFGTALVISVVCRSHLVQCLAATGEFDQGIRYGEEGIQIANEAEHSVSRIYANCSLGFLFLLRGDCSQAVQLLDLSMKICQSAGIPVYIPFVASRLGAAYATGGRIADALPYLQHGVGNSASVGRVGFLSLSMVWLSEGYLLSARTSEAHDVAKRALELAQTHKERGHEAWALKVLGDIAAHADPGSHESEVFYQRALTLARELGMRPLEAHCNFGLGKIYLRAQSKAAPRELSKAAALYSDMNMQFWLVKAETALAETH